MTQITDKNFKIGDLVVLNSGGPPMTVENILNDIIYCRYFDGNENCRFTINIACLENFKEDKTVSVP